MKTVTIKSPDGKSTFTIHAYKAGESVTVFKGSTGTFGKAAGSKTAGIVYVSGSSAGIHVEDNDVDNAQFWDWVAEWMNKGMAAEAKSIAA